jgi:membrane protein DedA with SNARE-associated domain
VGAAAWNAVLALLGWLAYQAADLSVIEKYNHQLSVIIIVLFCAAVAFFVVRAIIRKNKAKK